MDLWLYKAKVNGGNKDIFTVRATGGDRVYPTEMLSEILRD